MRIIAFEEHFTIPAITQAHKDHPSVRYFQADNPNTALVTALTDIDAARIAAMDEAGVGVQILSQTTPGPEILEPGLSVKLARQSNDTLAEAVALHPDRLLGFASLPLADPVTAVNEFERSITQLGFVGANINGHVNGEYLDNEKFWPVLEKAAELEVPIYLHPTRPTQPVVDALYSGFAPKVSEVLAGAAWGWHADTALHSLRLIIAGVFDRFPGLQLIIGHQGEFLPAAIDRAEQVFNEAFALDTPIRQVFDEHFWFAVSSGYNAYPPFAALVHAVGTDRIVFATDYPYAPMKPAVDFLNSLPLSERDREKIAHRNAEGLLRLGAA